MATLDIASVAEKEQARTEHIKSHTIAFVRISFQPCIKKRSTLNYG